MYSQFQGEFLERLGRPKKKARIAARLINGSKAASPPPRTVSIKLPQFDQILLKDHINHWPTPCPDLLASLFCNLHSVHRTGATESDQIPGCQDLRLQGYPGDRLYHLNSLADRGLSFNLKLGKPVLTVFHQAGQIPQHVARAT
jgi:hypothetical protein